MFLTCMRLMYRKRPERDRWWRVQRLKEQARHFWHRTMRSRLGLSRIYIRKANINRTNQRIVKPYIRNKLRQCRIDAACQEVGITRHQLKVGLRSSGVQLSSEMLSIIAIYEPRTFQQLTELAQRASIEKLYTRHIELPQRCFTKIPLP